MKAKQQVKAYITQKWEEKPMHGSTLLELKRQMLIATLLHDCYSVLKAKTEGLLVVAQDI